MNFLHQVSGGLIGEATLHPLLVHFPIVLFFVFMVLYVLNIYSEKLVSKYVNFGILVFLFIFNFVVKYTGENAGIEVGPTLTNPRALTTHAAHAIDFIWGVGFLLLSYTIVELFLIHKSIIKGKVLFIGRAVVLSIGIFTSVLLTQTGHTGATLVFKYAAGVDIPQRRAEKVIEKYRKENEQKNNEESPKGDHQ